MSYELIVIKSSGAVEKSETLRMPDLEQLQKAVGGYIESVPYFDQYEGRRTMYTYCNEYGRIENLPINAVATAAWRACLGTRTFNSDATTLRGDVAIVVKKRN